MWQIKLLKNEIFQRPYLEKIAIEVPNRRLRRDSRFGLISRTHEVREIGSVTFKLIFLRGPLG